jgi:hypothetical protein
MIETAGNNALYFLKGNGAALSPAEFDPHIQQHHHPNNDASLAIVQ